ncbi:MAG: type II toxin-antitoxin system mRNA interferase toxin, RelE/StbE family [Candidatus Vogelbacteria bacterium]|nr:type II toxin-antitoxin system mRNA interferase toxin, RelE/StbE family [Candidatus Vogelbacteria bacterium]
MIRVSFAPSFVRQYSKLDERLRDEIVEKIESLKQRGNSEYLKIHKLHGSLRDYYGLSVNYRVRIIFNYLNKDEIACYFIGDHDIYK